MGFLDHSTNNIIVDAVLTDLGRQALAKNDGSFNIYQFGLGDDEVDYSIIQKFGRTVGKEKIENVLELDEKISASGYARAKKWREDQARQKDREDNAKWEEKARTHKWDGKTWNKRDKPTHEKGTGPHARKLAGE